MRYSPLAAILISIPLLPHWLASPLYYRAPQCVMITLPDSVPAVASSYLETGAIIELDEDLAPIISDTVGLVGHPRRRLQVRSIHAPTPDYGAWWPLAGDSVALFWRFEPGRGVFVAASMRDSTLTGLAFLTLGQDRIGPTRIAGKRVGC